MRAVVPRVVRKVKLDGKWVFAALPQKNGKLDFTHVVYKGKTIPATSGTFHLDFPEGGKRRRPAIGDDPAAVRRALATQTHVVELRRRGVDTDDAPEIRKRPEGKALLDIATEFVESPPAGLGPASIKKYRGTLRQFVTWAAGKGITHALQVDDEVFGRFIRHLGAEGLSAHTINDKVVQLTGQLRRHGCSFGLKSTDLPKVTVKERSIYTRDQLQALLAAAPPEQRLLYQTFLLTGMREQEVAHLADTDIDSARCVLRVTAKPLVGFKPKNHEERSVAVPRSLVDALLKHLDGRKGFVFATSEIWAGRGKHVSGGKPDTNLLEKLQRLARRAGLNCGRCPARKNGKPVTCKTEPVCKQFGLHKFRHTYATTMLRDRVMDLPSLSKQLGHKDLNTTRIYLHALEAEELQADVEKSSLATLL